MPAAMLYICAVAVLSTPDSCGFSQGQTELQRRWGPLNLFKDSADQPHPPQFSIYTHCLCGFKLSIVFIK